VIPGSRHATFERIFAPAQPVLRKISWADAVVVFGIAATLWALTKLAAQAPTVIRGPDISLEPHALPLYAALSIARMVAAYVLSMIFTFIYGYFAASDKRRERILIPILDILQSIPILAYLPVVVMSLTAILPLGFAKELSAVLLIFTSQAWNLTFSWFQSLTTIPPSCARQVVSSSLALGCGLRPCSCHSEPSA